MNDFEKSIQKQATCVSLYLLFASSRNHQKPSWCL